ncbi:MAG: DnaJ domain-containing protein [Isosphaeraceae bacterium]
MRKESGDVPAFACCSAGIGRWFWVAWESESDARALAPALASGFEGSASRAEAKATERVGRVVKRLPGKWASGYRRGGGRPAAVPSAAEEPAAGDARPARTRISRFRASSSRGSGSTRLSFLYCVTEREPPDARGPIEVARHRIVKQNPRKIHVDPEPFDEGTWARRADADADGGESSADAPKQRTLAVGRVMLRTEGRFRCRHAQRELVFYASEEDGLRDVEAALTEKHGWCAVLGVRFPCTADSIKTAYRRLAMASHPDAGGEAARFQTIEQAYREALAYFARASDTTT